MDNFNTYISTLKLKVVAEGIVDTENDVTNKNLLARQWTHGDLLNNANLDLYVNSPGQTYTTDATTLCSPDCAATQPAYSSVMQLQMGFITEPEMIQSGCDVSTSFTTTKVLNMFE
jgi:hypothetical protein